MAKIMKKQFNNGSIVLPVDPEKAKKYRSGPPKIILIDPLWPCDNIKSMAQERTNKFNIKIKHQ